MSLTTYTKKMLVLGVGFLALAIVVVSLQAFYANALEQALIEEETAIARYEVETVAMQEVRVNVALAEADDEQLSSYFVTEESTVDVLNQLESDARRFGVELVTDDITLSPDSTPQYVRMRFRLSGSPSAVQSMLQVIDTMPYASWVSEVSYLEGESDAKATIVFNVVSK